MVEIGLTLAFAPRSTDVLRKPIRSNPSGESHESEGVADRRGGASTSLGVRYLAFGGYLISQSVAARLG